MQRRAVRLAVVLVLAIVMATASWAIFHQSRALEAARTRDAGAGAASARAGRALAHIAAAQRAYVAPGQGLDFWTRRVDDELVAAREALLHVRAFLRDSSSLARIDSALSRLDDFTQMDDRARALVREGEQSAASGLIFADGYEILDAAERDATAARDAASSVTSSKLSAAQRILLAALGALVISAAVLLLLMLRWPKPADPQPEVLVSPDVAAAQADTAAFSTAEEDELGAALDASLEASFRQNLPVSMESLKSTAEGRAPTVPPTPTSAPAGLAETAGVCVDLARLLDARDLNPVLARASDALGARGLVVWMVDGSGQALAPALTCGYPAEVVSRLGSLGVDSDNATAGAWRTLRAQVFGGSDGRPGALAVPMLTSEGCGGVLALEFDGGLEQLEETQSLARIVAAQLATSIAPAASDRRAAEA